jgi:hypothetical protein
MPNEPDPLLPIEVRFTPEFKRNIRQQRTTTGAIVLITIYSKTDQEDIAPVDIRQIILDYEAQQPATDSANREAPPPEAVADMISDK